MFVSLSLRLKSYSPSVEERVLLAAARLVSALIDAHPTSMVELVFSAFALFEVIVSFYYRHDLFCRVQWYCTPVQVPPVHLVYLIFQSNHITPSKM